MIKHLLSLTILLFGLSLQAQSSFSDDFDSYNVGDYLGTSSPNWTTWGNAPGGADDVKITDELAASGANSIKFVAVGAGGPADVISYFGGDKLTTGYLEYSMNIYVPSGKTAYYNLQGEVAVGTTWSINVTLEDGVVDVTGSGNASVMAGRFNHDEWVNIAMEINFDANSWKTLINGECIGTYANPDNSAASIDFFPTANGEFFIDDYRYEYTPTAPINTFDAGLSGIDLAVRGIAGQVKGVRGQVVNFGTDMISSFDVVLEYNGTTESTEFTGLSLAAGETFDFLLDSKYYVSEGSNDIAVSLANINGMDTDQEDCNNKVSSTFTAITPTPGKKVVMEEATGTWCGWCPRGSVAVDRFTSEFPDHFIGVAVHGGSTSEPMLFTEYITDMGPQGFPTSVIDRGPFTDPGATEAQIFQQLLTPVNATLVHGASYNESTRELEVSVEVLLTDDIGSGDWRINAVLTEDGVTGTTSGYAQANYFSGAQDLIDIHGVNYRDLPNPIPAADMVYDHVARASMEGFYGVPLEMEGMSAGATRTVSFTYTVPEEYDVDNMHIVSTLIQPNGRLNNGESSSIDEAIENGLGTSVDYSAELTTLTNVYPNPAQDFTTVAIDLQEASKVSIDIMDMTGAIIATQQYGTIAGQQQLQVETADLATGMYTLKINVNDQCTSQRLMKN